MQLTRKERLILYNQYHILEALYPDEKKFFEKQKEVIREGFELEFEKIIQFIEPDVVTRDECIEVYEILDMFSAIKRAYKEYKEEIKIDADLIRFSGFDENQESKLHAYAVYICGEGNYINIDRGDNLNSHHRVLPIYQEMLITWKTFPQRFKISKEELLTLIEVRKNSKTSI